jgi:hypothetical protein
MSVSEILAELPKLDPAELEIIFQRAVELQQGHALEASPELLQAIREADAISKDQDLDLEQAYLVVKSWNIK